MHQYSDNDVNADEQLLRRPPESKGSNVSGCVFVDGTKIYVTFSIFESTL